MGSHRRRDRKRDRNRLLPHHVLGVEEERVRIDEKRRKDRERKRLHRARGLALLEHDRETPPRSPIPHHHDASPPPPSPRLHSMSTLDVPTCPRASEETTTTPFSSRATTPFGVGESSPYFVHMASHTLHDVSPMHLHEHVESVHPSHSPEGTTPCLSPTLEGGVSPHILPLSGTVFHPLVAPIASPSSPLPHVGDEELPYSPPSHDLVPTGLLDSSGSFGPDTGRSLSRGASRSRAERIAMRHFHGLDVPSQVQVLEELLRLPLMASCV